MKILTGEFLNEICETHSAARKSFARCTPNIYLKDTSGRIVYLNDAALIQLGIRPEALAKSSLTFFELFNESDAAVSEELDQSVLDSGKPLYEKRERFRWQNNWPLGPRADWYRVSRIPIKLPGSQENALLVIHRETTKDSETADRFFRLYHASTKIDVMTAETRQQDSHSFPFIHELDGRIVFADQRLLDLFEVKEDPSSPSSDLYIQNIVDEPYKSQITQQQRNGFVRSTRNFLAAATTVTGKKVWLQISSDREQDTLFGHVVRGYAKLVSREVDNVARLLRAAVGAQLNFFELDFRSKTFWSNHPALIEGSSHSFSGFLAGVADSYRNSLKAEVKAAATNAEIADYETVFPWKLEGGVRWLKAKGAFSRDSTGAALLLSGTFTDITDDHAQETQIQILQSAMDSLSDTLVFLKDHRGKFLFVNQYFASIFNKVPGDFVDLDDEAIGLSPEEVAAVRAIDNDVLTTGVSTPPVDEILYLNGRKYHLRTVKQQLTLNGMPAVLGIAANVSDIVEKEANLRTLIDALPVAIHIKSRDGKYELTNKAFLAKAGRDENDSIIGQTCDTIFPNYAQSIRERDREVHSGGSPITYKVWIRQKPRESRRYEITKLPSAHGGIIGLSRDITEEEKRKRSELKNAYREQRIEAMETLIRSLRHDLLAKLLLSLTDDISAIAQNDRRFREFVQMLQFISRYIDELEWWLPNKTRNIVVNKIALNLRDVVVRIADWASQAVRTPIVQNKVSENLLVTADQSLLHVCLLNLIHNAKKMTPDDRAKSQPIVVSAISVSDNNIGQATRISVEDGAGGFPPDLDVDQLGKEIGIAKDAVGRSTRGSGFGVFLCAKIVDAHGGVFHRPEPNHRGGVTFAFSLPKDEDQQ